jgi:hypothetical protein
MPYQVGDSVRLTCTFTDLAGAVADPTAITCTVLNPARLRFAASVTRSATGIYYADVTLDSAGDWRYRWTGTGAIVAADEGILAVDRSRF